MNTTENKKSARELYEDNWEWMIGLQMSKVVADFGYNVVKDLPKGKALDIGCGDGTNTIQLKIMGYDAQGCDISSNAVAKARKRGLKATRVDTNHLPLPYASGQFQLIWLSDVLEHVFWPEGLISEIYRLLSPGGYLFVSTPNVSWWGIRLQILFGKILRDIHPEHVWWFNWPHLRKVLISEGFVIKDVQGYNCLVPHPMVGKLPALQNFNRMGKINSILSYTFAVLCHKK